MKLSSRLLALLLAAHPLLADGLPVITSQPQNLSAIGVFSVGSPNATGFQWRWNGTDIPAAINSTLSRTMSDPVGYYMVVVKNATGWVPSQLAYLSRGSGGYVPFSNLGNPNGGDQVRFGGQPRSTGFAQVVAGPELDQMQPVGEVWDFSLAHQFDPSLDGYFDLPDQELPNVSPGQTVYYRVVIDGGFPSTTLKLIAGGGPYPTPSAAGLRFPGWPEWPEPIYQGGSDIKQVRIPGETFSLTNRYFAYADYGTPRVQWRKDGRIIPGATNFGGGFFYQTVFSITNLQATDVGTYDVQVFGNAWMVKPTINLSVQLANAPGRFLPSSLNANNFVCNLAGVASRNYLFQWSPDLVSWNDLFSRSNVSGTISFTNSSTAGAGRFYRARLLP